LYYLRLFSKATLVTAASMLLFSCAQPNKALNPSSANSVELTSTTDNNSVSLDTLIDQNQDSAELVVGQPLLINPISQPEKWRVTLGRHDFAKVEIDRDPQKVQREISFKSAGQFRLTVHSVIAKGPKSSTAPNVMQQQFTVIVKEK
jgi:hypothetical protein